MKDTKEAYCPLCRETQFFGYIGTLKNQDIWACPSTGTQFYTKDLDEAFLQAGKKDAKALLDRKLFTLPTDSESRKGYPLFSGVLRYFSAALAGVARISKLGNDKHNPGQPLHHARGKSMDHGDCILRHLVDVEDLLVARERGDTSITNEQILTEVSSMAWRALAFSQELHERLGAAPMAPGAK